MANVAKYGFFSERKTIFGNTETLLDLQKDLDALQRSTYSYVQIHCKVLTIRSAIEKQLNDLTKELLDLQAVPLPTPKQTVRLALLTSAIEKQTENLDRIQNQIEKSGADELITQRLLEIEELEQRIGSALVEVLEDVRPRKML
ncbi:MAG: hypothetical protein P4M14_05210 [Gammaproteobacteria bacterium]|nr:hypothetical protein [Gammaproteobacteria bacterium]